MFQFDVIKQNLRWLDEQIGTPAMSHMPQNINQGFVYILKQLTDAVEQLEQRVKILESNAD